MASSESAPAGSAVPGTVGADRTTLEATGELRVTTELPPSERSPSTARRRFGRRPARRKPTDTGSTDSGTAGTERQPLFVPAQRPGRRVVRIVRHVQLWSVFKVALLGGLVFYAIFLLATGLGWSLANATGQVHRIEQFMRQIGFDNWSFDGPQLFRAAALLGALLLCVGSVLITLAAALVNLIAEATGGIRFTVIELDESDDDDTDEPDEDH